MYMHTGGRVKEGLRTYDIFQNLPCRVKTLFSAGIMYTVHFTVQVTRKEKSKRVKKLLPRVNIYILL